MPHYDFKSPRLFVPDALSPGRTIAIDAAQAHYLQNVLRLKTGAAVLAFNGRDGEWRAELIGGPRGRAVLSLKEALRRQSEPTDLHYLFAPLKRARLDYMVQKAVEMGVSRLQPVVTQHTQAERVNTERMKSNAIEAAEQCGVLAIPDIGEPVALSRALADLGGERLLVFCDETADVADPIVALSQAGAPERRPPLPLAVIVGPEGGFSDGERRLLLAHPAVVQVSLGPRILRADTAAVAALALVQAVLGDWKRPIGA